MTLQRILVPTDFSECGNSAIEQACELAANCKATLHLLHVARPVLEETDERTRLRVEFEKLNSLVSATNELSLETVKDVVVGRAAPSITDYVREHEIQLIVMGTHGRTGLAHLALGSVAERVLRTAFCPVMVVQRKGSSTSELLEDAASALARKHGRSLAGSWAETKKKLEDTIQSSLDISNSIASRTVDELQQREWIGSDFPWGPFSNE